MFYYLNKSFFVLRANLALEKEKMLLLRHDV